MGREERLRPGTETAFGFDLQKTGAVGRGQFRQLGLQAQHPAEREADRATPFADARLVEMIADFLADQLGGIGQRVQRQRNGQGLPEMQSAVAAAQGHHFKAVAVQGQAEDGGGALSFEQLE